MELRQLTNGNSVDTGEKWKVGFQRDDKATEFQKVLVFSDFVARMEVLSTENLLVEFQQVTRIEDLLVAECSELGSNLSKHCQGLEPEEEVELETEG